VRGGFHSLQNLKFVHDTNSQTNSSWVFSSTPSLPNISLSNFDSMVKSMSVYLKNSKNQKEYNKEQYDARKKCHKCTVIISKETCRCFVLGGL
jgi:glucan phosphorylase